MPGEAILESSVEFATPASPCTPTTTTTTEPHFTEGENERAAQQSLRSRPRYRGAILVVSAANVAKDAVLKALFGSVIVDSREASDGRHVLAELKVQLSAFRRAAPKTPGSGSAPSSGGPPPTSAAEPTDSQHVKYDYGPAVVLADAIVAPAVPGTIMALEDAAKRAAAIVWVYDAEDVAESLGALKECARRLREAVGENRPSEAVVGVIPRAGAAANVPSHSVAASVALRGSCLAFTARIAGHNVTPAAGEPCERGCVATETITAHALARYLDGDVRVVFVPLEDEAEPSNGMCGFCGWCC